MTDPFTNSLVGKVLDNRYEILAKVGEGGMGTVFKAKHTGIGRIVALKVLHPHAALSSRTLGRFMQEMQAMSAISHPHLIAISDAGTCDNATPYFVMEYLEGRTLDELLESEKRLSVERTIKIVSQMCEALEYAHEKGIIHRDIKPTNIMLIGKEGKDFVKIVDLGIAKILSPETTGANEQLTQTGEVFGSPAYMSPEQCLGRPQDPRTDIYAVGCVMFKMLTGHEPFKGDSALETLYMHASEKAKAFSEVAPDLRMNEALERLEWITLKCLDKSPDGRYQSMNNLLLALGADKDVVPQQSGNSLSASIRKAAENAKKPIVGEVSPQTKSAPHTVVLTLPRAGIIAVSAVGVLLALLIAKQLISAQQPQELYTNTSSVPANNAVALNSYMPKIDPNLGYRPGDHKIFKAAFSAPASEPNVQALSVYCGTRPPEYIKELKHRGMVRVDVNSEKKPVVLVLSSYCPTTWSIHTDNDRVKIEKVIASGYFPPIIEGLPKDVPVERSWYEHLAEDGSHLHKGRDNPFPYFYLSFSDSDADISNNSDFQKMQSIVQEHTGLHIQGFAGSFTTDRFSIN